MVRRFWPDNVLALEGIASAHWLTVVAFRGARNIAEFWSAPALPGGTAPGKCAQSAEEVSGGSARRAAGFRCQ